MANAAIADEAQSRYGRLRALLDSDPRNPALLADAAEAALTARRFDDVADLVARHDAAAAPAARTIHLAGLAAMGTRRWDAAADLFAQVLASGEDAAPVRFNAAWSLAMAGRGDEALALLDDTTTSALPQAAALLVTLLHDRGDLDEAEARGRALLDAHPGDRGLNAAMSTLAIDIEDIDLAARCAAAAGDHPEALVTLGTLALGEQDTVGADASFGRALAANPGLPRAWIGRGLARLTSGDKTAAAADIDRGATLFGSHVGSWIAAGWAHVVAGDRATGRTRFDTAMALDDRFAETHGSLAVVDLLDGRQEDARRGVEIALRLDRQCFSAALASTLIAAGAGDHERARRIFDLALGTPIDGGQTIGQALARLGLSR